MKKLKPATLLLMLANLLILPGSLAIADSYDIDITPKDVRLNIGEQVQFQARLTDDNGNEVITPFEWSIKKGSDVGTITQDGLFTAEQNGKAEVMVTAPAYNKSEDTQVHVGQSDGDDDHGDDDDDDDHHGKYSPIEFIVQVNPHKVELGLGAQVQFMASVFDLQNNPVDTSVTWELSGWPIGEIDESGLFTAQAYGEAHVIARVGQDYGKAKLEVEDEDHDGHGDDHGHHHGHYKMGYTLTLAPLDTAVYVGDTVQYTAVLMDSNGQVVEANQSWKVEHHSAVGTITSDGLFTAMQPGLAFIEVKAKDIEARTSIQVMDREGGVVNSMSVYRVLPNGAVIDDSVTIYEGDMLKLDGLPFPFQILNGSMVTLPDGALHEDIDLTIDLSGLADVQGDSVLHPQNIVNAIEFNVSVGADTIHPYYFDKPLRISIPYDRDMLIQYGIDPDSLNIAYYLGDDFLDRVGIENVVVDTSQNRIFAEIIHFSTLVIFTTQQTLTGAETKLNMQPGEFTLHQNYPNPFNPSTTISFDLERSNDVQVNIYNVAGQRIRTLYQGLRNPGYVQLTWDARDDNGFAVPSGLYYYKVSAGTQTETRRMLLLR